MHFVKRGFKDVYTAIYDEPNDVFLVRKVFDPPDFLPFKYLPEEVERYISNGSWKQIKAFVNGEYMEMIGYDCELGNKEEAEHSYKVFTEKGGLNEC